MNIDTAINYALMGDAILFLGSGASVGAINQNDECFPIGVELANRLHNGCTNLEQAADLFREELSIDNKDADLELINFLKRQFRAKSITEYQKMIPSVPWKRIYTTNYDNIVESAYNFAGKYIRSLSICDKAKAYLGNNETIYLHINGSIDVLNKSTLDNQFRLTDFSYNTNVFNGNEWGTLFENDLKTYSAIFFVGFSMNYDLDIRRIVSTINKEKCIFVVSENESEINIKSLQKYGTVERIGVDGLFDRISILKNSFNPKEYSEKVLFSNFERIHNTPILNKPNDKEVLSYYKTGKKSLDLYCGKNNGYDGIVKRSIVNEVATKIKEHAEAIFIHSDIGNGKTEIIDQICLELSSDFQIYKLKDNNEKIIKEIEQICSDSKIKIVIIENFFDYKDVYEKFKIFNSNNNITFIFTARTSIYRSRFEQFEFNQMFEYDVNRLDNIEIEKLVSIFDEYGYYPKEKLKTDYKSYIIKKYNSRLQAIVLGIFENKSIVDSLRIIMEDICSLDYESQNILMFMIIVKMMNLELNFSDVLDLLSTKSLNYNFRNSISVNELIYFQDMEASIKSPILCTWILKNYKNYKRIFEILIVCAKQADIGWEINRKYSNFLGNIISYKHLKFLINIFDNTELEKKELIYNFYQNMKNLDYYKDKYFFWLQYGISALELEDYESAEHHFNAALSKFHGDKIAFEVNNQIARLRMILMLKSQYNYNENTFIEILEINKLLTPTNCKEDDEYYCYKMSSSYYPKLFEKFFGSMTEYEQQGMKQMASDNFILCSKYILKNNNDNLTKSVSKILPIYENLSKYSENEEVNFKVKCISKYFATGEIIVSGEIKDAQVHISNISKEYVRNINHYLKVKQVVNATIIGFNKEKNIFDLSLK